MKRMSSLLMTAVVAGLAVSSTTMLSAQPTPDKYAVQVPNGLSLSEFKGNEGPTRSADAPERQA